MRILKSKFFRNVVCASLLFSFCFSEAAFSLKDNFLVNAGKRAISAVKSRAASFAKAVKSLVSKSPKETEENKKTGNSFFKGVRALYSKWVNKVKRVWKKRRRLIKERDALWDQFWQARRDGNNDLEAKYLREFAKKQNELFMLVIPIVLSVYIGLIALVAVSFFIEGAMKKFSRKYRCQFCGRYLYRCTCGAEDKLRHACKRGFSCSRVKKIVESLDDINVTMRGALFNGLADSPLHCVCHGGDRFIDVVKWMVQDKFADVNKSANGGAIPRESLGFWLINCDKTRRYLNDMENKHNDLVARVINLSNDLKQKNYEDIQKMKHNFEEIKKIMASKDMPGYAKQQVMPELVRINVNFANVVSNDDLEDLYKHIEFNYSFLNDPLFTDAVKFAIQFLRDDKLVRDIQNRTVWASAIIHGIDDRYHEDMFENDYFYEQSGLFKAWLERRSTPGTWNWVFDSESIPNDDDASDQGTSGFKRKRMLKKEIIEGFSIAKKLGKKKPFRDFANRLTVADDLNTKLPGELVAKVLMCRDDIFGEQARVNFKN